MQYITRELLYYCTQNHQYGIAVVMEWTHYIIFQSESRSSCTGSRSVEKHYGMWKAQELSPWIWSVTGCILYVTNH